MLSGYASSGTCHQTIQLSGQKDVKATHQNGFITPNSSKICIDEWFSLRPFILQIARSFVYVCASGILAVFAFLIGYSKAGRLKPRFFRHVLCVKLLF
jgi:hypothetical protein